MRQLESWVAGSSLLGCQAPWGAPAGHRSRPLHRCPKAAAQQAPRPLPMHPGLLVPSSQPPGPIPRPLKAHHWPSCHQEPQTEVWLLMCTSSSYLHTTKQGGMHSTSSTKQGGVHSTSRVGWLPLWLWQSIEKGERTGQASPQPRLS